MSRESRSSTVLVVEDDEAVADLYATWLRHQYDVHVVNSGEAAVDLVAETAIDVVLLDRKLPDRSGDEVLVTLRDRGIDAPVAMVSGKDIQTDIIDLGFDEYAIKPVDRSTLVGIVDELAARPSYDAIQRELSELQVKRNVLETELPPEELNSTDRYAALLDRIDELRTRAREYRSRRATDPAASKFQKAT